MIRRFGEPPVAGQYYSPRPGAYVILPRGQSILLTHQSEPEPEYQLPGGGIDMGESAIAALHREVFEETGWHISSPKKVSVYRRFTYMPEYDKWAEKLCHIYIARPIYSVGPPKEKAHTAVWMSVSNAADHLASDGDRYVLQQCIT